MNNTTKNRINRKQRTRKISLLKNKKKVLATCLKLMKTFTGIEEGFFYFQNCAYKYYKAENTVNGRYTSPQFRSKKTTLNKKAFYLRHKWTKFRIFLISVEE